MSEFICPKNERPDFWWPIRFSVSHEAPVAGAFAVANVAGLVCGIVLLCSFVFGSRSVAQDGSTQTGEGEKSKVEFLKHEIRVTDPDGNPVEGATIVCTGLRALKERGSHYWWSESRLGEPAPEVQTNGEGFAVLKYPRFVFEKLETGSITFSVSHPDFIFSDVDRSVMDGLVVQLKRGFRIALTAKNAETGEQVLEQLYAVIGLRNTAQWKLKRNGMLVSGVYPKQKCYLRVVQLAEGRPVLFSKMLTVDPGDKSRVLLRDVELLPGVRLEGKLDDSVKRPIVNGFVAGCAEIVMEPRNWRTSWAWSDRAEIRADGTFVFESLPQDVVWQMIPVCDGWVAEQPAFESVAANYPSEAPDYKDLIGRYNMPQLARLDRDRVSATLKMKPAATVKVTFTDEAGVPIEGVQAGMYPNHVWFDGGSTILGHCRQTWKALRAQRAGSKVEYDLFSRFADESGKDGVARIENLPARINAAIAAMHDDYELPIADGTREYTFELKEGEQKEITVKLQPKGTGPKLGEGLAGDEAQAKFDFEGLQAALKGMLNWIL